MQLKFDWLIVLENLRRGILVTDTIKTKLSNREVFHGQTWNYRKNGERPKPI
jgi:hypothetical protein